MWPSHILAFCSDPLGSIEISRSRTGRRFKTFPSFLHSASCRQQNAMKKKQDVQLKKQQGTQDRNLSTTYYCKVHLFDGKAFLISILRWLHFHAFFGVSCRGEAEKNSPLSNRCDKNGGPLWAALLAECCSTGPCAGGDMPTSRLCRPRSSPPCAGFGGCQLGSQIEMFVLAIG